MTLEGRSAIITGANRGLGAAIAQAYAEQGAAVLLTARDEALLHEVATTLDGDVHVMRADVSIEDDCTAVARRAAEVFDGGPTILVNNAGVYGPKGLIEDVDWAEWVKATEINLFGLILMCRAVIPAMRAKGYGKIVNLSGGGATNPMPRLSSYAATKAAVVRMTETLALELADAQVDVNAIAPGALNTRLLDEVLEAGPEQVGQAFYDKSVQQQQKGGAPLSKGADLAVWLGSGDSDGVTGRLISALWDDYARTTAEHLDGSDVWTLRRITPEDRADFTGPPGL